MSFTCDDENLVCAGQGYCPRCTQEYDDGVRDDPPPRLGPDKLAGRLAKAKDQHSEHVAARIMHGDGVDETGGTRWRR